MLESSRKKTILVIDDMVNTLTAIRTMLEGSFEVCLAKSANIALVILRTTEIDMILLDMEMPDMSGVEFLNIIHKDPSFYHIPVIMVSSHGVPDIIIETQKAGAKDFVVKPVSPKVLLEKIYALFKVTPTKIARDVLVRKLNQLASACKQGKTNRVEDLVQELEGVYFNLEVDGKLEEICKCAGQMEYKLAYERIEKLIRSPRLDDGRR